jgi:hypothetical protein
MSKRIGNINLTIEAVKGLKGFEDVFEDYVESEEFKELERKNQDSQKLGEQYELQSFLEQENLRLTCLEKFLATKIPSQVFFSQTEKLIILQNEKKEKIQNKISEEVKKLDSKLQKNLAHIFNSHFN